MPARSGRHEGPQRQQRHGEVPRHDDAHHPSRLAQDGALFARVSQAIDGDVRRFEQLFDDSRPVNDEVRRRQYFAEHHFDVRLADFLPHARGDCLCAIEHAVLERDEALRARTRRKLGPRGLCLAGLGYGRVHVRQ